MLFAAAIGLPAPQTPPPRTAVATPVAAEPAACQDLPPVTLRRAAHPTTPAHARAVWIDARTLRWPGKSGGRYALVASPTGELATPVGSTVAGASDTLPLSVVTAPLPSSTTERVKHLATGLTLALPEGATLPLTAQLLLVELDPNGRVLDATNTQLALAIDDLLGEVAVRVPLGAIPRARGTTFALWAPTAQRVSVCLEAPTPREVPLTRDAASGVWQRTVPEAGHGTRYTYVVEVFVPGTGLVRNRVTDPWALGLTANSARSVVVDLTHPSLRPAGWTQRRVPPLRRVTDQVIYELHVRDFSVRDSTVPTEHRGRYLAFTHSRSVGMRHLRDLARAGMTDVHLLPVFDIATIPETGCVSVQPTGAPDAETQQALATANAAADCFNWGYDPLHYTVPEGSYATNADDFAVRIREFRQMVQALNAAGLRVGMDVVYNHTSAAGQQPQSVLDRVVPGYYQRLDANGAVETSTCCANTATEHRMMARLMIESAVTWVQHYGISSFRFDLMGHQPRLAMEQLQRAVNRAAGTHVPLIGEGWNFGEVADGRRFVQASQLSLAGSGIATFSDRARDAIRGGSAMDNGIDQLRNLGFVNGLGTSVNGERARGRTTADERAALMQAADMVRVGLAGTVGSYRLHTATGDTMALRDLRYGGGQPAGYVTSPGEVVNYVENHDNQTLFDLNVFKLPMGTSGDERARVQHLASALVLFSQGIAYVHAGQELLRSKSMDRNSFDSGDWFNSYDPSGAWHGFARGLPPRRDNEASWPWMRARLADTSIRATPAQVQWTRNAFLDLLRIRRSSPLFRLGTAAEVSGRLRFANTGPQQEPTVVVGHLDGRGLPIAARGRCADLLYAVNVDVTTHRVEVPWLRGRPLQPHPVHRRREAADTRAREARWQAATATLALPPRTAVVFTCP